MTISDLMALPGDRQDALLSACRDELRQERERYETQMVMQLLAQLYYVAAMEQSHVHQSAT